MPDQSNGYQIIREHNSAPIKVAGLLDKLFLGTHIIAEFWGAKNLADIKTVEENLINAAYAAKATVLGSYMHDFGPNFGVTGVVILAESHISIHSWPEYAYAALDIFTCGNAEPHLAIENLKLSLKPSRVEIHELKRGTKVFEVLI